MNKPKNILAVCLFVSLLNSCASAKDDILSPPTDTKWVNVEIKNPSPYTKPFPLEVVYISHKCMKSRINGVDGSREEKPGYNPVKIPLQQQESSNIWHAKIAINGGGSCEWKLSEFNLGIEYIDATHLGIDIVPGTAVGATFAFDNIAAQNGKFDDITKNKLEYNPKYYPLIKRRSEEKNATESDRLYLFGKDKSFWNVFIHAKKNESVFIYFYPVVDESKVVEMHYPYEKKKGAMFKFTYPNGDTVMTKNNNPDFDKLDKMIVK